MPVQSARRKVEEIVEPGKSSDLMALRRLEILVVMLAVLAGPHRCCCGIRTAAASGSETECEPSGGCSCCTGSGTEATADSSELSAGESDHGPCSCACADQGSQPDDGGCPSRGKPRQAWDTGADGHAAKFRPAPAVEPWVGVSCATERLLTTSSRAPVRSYGERDAVGGRSLLLRLQILRC